MTHDEFHCFTPLFFILSLVLSKVSYTKLMCICKTCNTIASVQCNKMESWASWFDNVSACTQWTRERKARRQVYNVILKLWLNTVIPIWHINVCTGFIYTLFWLKQLSHAWEMHRMWYPHGTTSNWHGSIDQILGVYANMCVCKCGEDTWKHFHSAAVKPRGQLNYKEVVKF